MVNYFPNTYHEVWTVFDILKFLGFSQKAISLCIDLTSHSDFSPVSKVCREGIIKLVCMCVMMRRSQQSSPECVSGSIQNENHLKVSKSVWNLWHVPREWLITYHTSWYIILNQQIMALTTLKDFRIGAYIAEISMYWKLPFGLKNPVCPNGAKVSGYS